MWKHNVSFDRSHTAMMWMSRQLLYEIPAVSFHPIKFKPCFKILSSSKDNYGKTESKLWSWLKPFCSMGPGYPTFPKQKSDWLNHLDLVVMRYMK